MPHPRAFVRALRTAGQLLQVLVHGVLPAALAAGAAAADAAAGRRSWRRAGMDRASRERFRREIVGEPGALPGGMRWYRGMPRGRPRGSAGGSPCRRPYVWSDGDVALGRDRGRAHRGVRRPATYRFEVLEGASHWIPEQEPERLARIVLDRVRPS